MNIVKDALDAGLLLGQSKSGEEVRGRPPLSGQKSTSSPTLEEYIILQDLQRRNSAICCQEKL